ncbi:plasmid partitioning protein RepB [Rhodobacteraceae bacterium RKSG542]|uniref:plasmid partitioning protein RepB n=1 Tax=Pseudovibrio flavus TaxID=2529854 RepID=UPI0012BB928A|nr:plasmid partitioning protein RepB [Pseudovibrio flavus]MTI15913.1 plasmid partitioning protein RepB [Pseudovibrio flavus]
MNEKRKRNKSKLSAIMTGNNAALARSGVQDAVETVAKPRENSAVGRLGAALHSLTEQRTETIDPSLVIKNLDAKLLMPSIAMDRAFETDDDELSSLAQSILENGQQVPVLVRPHPSMPGHYQIAYGHRRVKACQSLDIAVRAVVENLTDEQLVIAQGKENEERKNLTYIQQCFFAAQLAKTFTREVVAAAVGAGDKTRVSKLTSIIRRVPNDILESIGSAPGVGRVKWEVIAKACEEPEHIASVRDSILELKNAGKWQAMASADRFAWVLDLIQVALVKSAKLSSQSEDELKSGTKAAAKPPTLIHTSSGNALMEARGRAFKIVLKDEQRAQAFADYLQGRMNELWREFDGQGDDT